MDKRYKHQEFEAKIYEQWEKQGYFTPEIDRSKKPFCIIMPPPNANGALHIGHAMFVTIEDILIRWQRMLGSSTLWLPGADHAGILTQVVFERELEKQGKTRHDLGREEFIERCLEFTLKNKEIMYNQFRLLGASCDWTRERFTLDKDVSEIVFQTFFRLYNDGLVYRDWRMISWCPRCQTALSDLEVNYKEEKSKLWYIKYPLEDGSGFVVVATTRPETMLGDTAVAVHPDDQKYKPLVGKKVILPLMNRLIPIVADEIVDPEFGTGAVKVTPAHDPDDFELGEKHNLEKIQVIGFDAKMTEQAGDFAGLEVLEARQEVIKKLEEQGLIEKIENYTHRVGHCERCKTIIEPLISLQWFISMKPLAEKAIEAVKQGETAIIPRRFNKVYFQWLENIRDWCISRQLWWGHRLPIWYCGFKGLSELQKIMNPELLDKHASGCGEVFVGQKPPTSCPKCKGTDFVQDPDTFDTWFSSGQWPYSTLGYPDKEDYLYFYPTSVMETGYDILFFWVARMMMLGLYATKKVPFKTIFLHGMVRDVFGKPMSKSRPETCIDPSDTIKQHGTDALRMALVYGTSAGRDVVVTEEKIIAMRNFANKVWNAARFIFLMAENENWKIDSLSGNEEDKAILAKNKELIKSITSDLNKYRFGQALEKIYQFFWHEFCDQYLEQSKKRSKEALPVLLNILVSNLKLLHPFAPFVTEAIYRVFREKLPDHPLFDSKHLIVSSWPLEQD
jgi:valyl-tRNA synthetase